MKIESGFADEKITGLLKESGLPVTDLKTGSDHVLFFYTGGKDLTGTVGLEPFGDIALLRSLAVKQSERGKRIGRRLVNELENYSRNNGIRVIYLLTTDAEKYFQKLDYVVISKNDAPVSIKNSKQFSEICPGSSVLMRKNL